MFFCFVLFFLFCLLVLTSWEKNKNRRRRFSSWYLGDGSHVHHLYPLSKCVQSAETVNTGSFLQPGCTHSSPTHVSVSILAQPIIALDYFPDTLKTLACVINSQEFKEGKKYFCLNVLLPLCAPTEQPNKLLC